MLIRTSRGPGRASRGFESAVSGGSTRNPRAHVRASLNTKPRLEAVSCSRAVFNRCGPEIATPGIRAIVGGSGEEGRRRTQLSRVAPSGSASAGGGRGVERSCHIGFGCYI
ncbi:hypothetical protein NL676_031723 [Syzygium grande]|nr:hypothetical protein NL676_031723 [Syzygium grande]